MGIFDLGLKRGPYWAFFVGIWAVSFLAGMGLPYIGFPPALALIVAVPVWLLICVARLDDMGRSGWFSLLTLVPIAGLVAIIWMGITPSDTRPGSVGHPGGR